MFTHQTMKFRGDASVQIDPNDKDVVAKLRELRETACFPVINRGLLWYNMLSQTQLSELENWYIAWLNVTITRRIPKRPDWLDNVSDEGEDELW